jgi:DDE superfamily endonuclease
MLPEPTLPASLLLLLGALQPCFTRPSFRTFCGLVAGLAGQLQRRTVAGMLLGAGLSRCWPHDRAHYFFARARWDADQLGLAVAQLAVMLLVAPGEAITVAVDDSLFRRSGRTVHGARWQHDGSAPSRAKISFGTCFVTAGIIVRLPFCSRPVCLPVLARLHIPARNSRSRQHVPQPGSKVSQAAGLVILLAAAFPGRTVHVVADAYYHGPQVKNLPDGLTWTCRLMANAALYDLAPRRRPGTRGRPRVRGARLGTPADLAAAADWAPATVAIYGRRQDIGLAERTCLWYGCLHTRTVRVIIARDSDGDLALVTTDLATPAATVIERYAARWSIEQAFSDVRNVLGGGQARNRVRAATERTVPFSMLVHTLVIIWYARHGHHDADIARRRATQPWYQSKTEPAFEDMLTKLRRVMITTRISRTRSTPPDTEEIQDVLAAWIAAAA